MCEFLKNSKQNKAVHVFVTDDKILNPVKGAWAIKVQRIWKTVPGVSEHTKVYTFWTGWLTNEFNLNITRSKSQINC